MRKAGRYRRTGVRPQVIDLLEAQIKEEAGIEAALVSVNVGQ
jgi:hypothetical protein